MASLGKAFIEIHADLKEFPAETKVKLKEALEGAAKDMNLAPVEKKMSEAGKKAGEAVEKSMSAKLREKYSEFTKRGNEIGDKIMSGVTGMIFSKATMMTSLIATAVLAVGQLIGPALGALAAVPAAIGVAVVALGTMKAATKGVGDAIKAAFGDDQQALNQAMAKLAPAAREVVAEFASFRGQLHGLQQDIQQTFFVQLEGSVKRLMTTLLPGLRSGLHLVAADLGKMARGVVDVLSSPSGKSGIAAILLAAHQVIVPLIPAVRSLVASFITLGAAGGRFAASLSGGFANLLNRFAEFVSRISSDGTLSSFFDLAMVGLKALASLFGDLFSIVTSIFKGVTANGGDVVGVIGLIVHEIALLFAGPQGQELIGALLLLIQTIGQILIAIAPVLPSLALLIAHVGTDLAHALIASLPLIDRLVAMLSSLLTWMDAHKSAVEGFAVALGVMFAVFKTAKAIDAAVTSLKTFTDAVKALSVIQAVAGWMRGMAAAQATATVASDTLTASLVAQDAAWFANPIGLVILAIALIIAGIVLLIMNWDKVKKAGEICWHAIENAAKAVWNWLKGVGSSIGDFFSGIGRWFEDLPGKIGSWLASLPSLLGNLFLNALSFAGQMVAWGLGLIIWSIVRLPGLIWEGLKDLGKFLGDLFADAWKWATHAVSVGIDATVDFFVKLPGRIGNFLSSLPGVISGAFKTAWTWVKDETGKAGDWIVAFAKGLPGKLGNFLGNVGGDIVKGLKAGINAAIKGFNHGVDQVGDKLHIGLPHIPMLAKGAIIDSPTLAVIGERGREVVMPLNDPARAQQLAAQSGLLGILKQTSPAPIVQVTAYLGTGQILEVLKTVVNNVVNGQAADLANGVRAA